MQSPQPRPTAQMSLMHEQGFTLLELMIAIAIIAIISAIGMPLYRNYVNTAEEGVLVTNMSSIEMFQEDFMLRNGSYAVNLGDKAAIEAAIGWEPRDGGEFGYSIAASDGTFYRLTGTDGAGHSICLQFPGKTACP